MASLETEALVFESKRLLIPSLLLLSSQLREGLKYNFQDVRVEVIQSPDFSQPPFNLAAKGINGNPVLLEVGGAPYLLPLVNKSKLYELQSVVKRATNDKPYEQHFVCGAGAGPFPFVGSNAEGIYNFRIDGNGSVENESRAARVDRALRCQVLRLPQNETRCALLGNFLVSEGKQGQVLHVNVKVRTGEDDFITAIRKTLAAAYNETVGLGGFFLLKNGKAKQHVMPEFSEEPLNTDDDLNNWLKFYDMPAQLLNVGLLVTDEADLDLRLQHFHSYDAADGKWGGHYHIDTTPDIVEYDGYFVVGEKIVRVDKPLVTHKFGRD